MALQSAVATNVIPASYVRVADGSHQARRPRRPGCPDLHRRASARPRSRACSTTVAVTRSCSEGSSTSTRPRSGPARRTFWTDLEKNGTSPPSRSRPALRRAHRSAHSRLPAPDHRARRTAACRPDHERARPRPPQQRRLAGIADQAASGRQPDRRPHVHRRPDPGARRNRPMRACSSASSPAPIRRPRSRPGSAPMRRARSRRPRPPLSSSTPTRPSTCASPTSTRSPPRPRFPRQCCRRCSPPSGW